MDTVYQILKDMNFSPVAAAVFAIGMVWAYKHSKVDEAREERFLDLFKKLEVNTERLTVIAETHKERIQRLEQVTDDAR